MKVCTKCKKMRQENEFAADLRHLDGLQSQCRECQRKGAADWYLRNQQVASANACRYYQENKEKQNENARNRYAKDNSNFVAARKSWEKRNRDKTRARWQRHDAAKRQAIPLWADHGKIEEKFSLARKMEIDTGISHHVDHIVPLQSDIVCGLHCEENLMVLSASENTRKGNRIWPDMP